MPSKELLKRIKLPFQKLDTMLLNDIKLFLRDRKSLVLVVLTPFLILSILINIYSFSGVAETIKGVELGVCDKDNSGFDLKSDIFKPTVHTGNCDSEVADKVSRGEYRGAVIIPDDFQQDIRDGKGTEIKLFIDNSKSTTAVVVSNAVKAYVSDLNERIGTEFILEAWKQLKELNENLRFLVKTLEKARPAAVELQQRLNTLNAQIGTIDFDAHQQAASDVVAYLDVLDTQLAAIQQGYNVTEVPQIPMMNATPNASVTIQEYRAKSSLLRDDLCNLTLLIPVNPACTLLDYTDSMADSLESEALLMPYYQHELNAKIAELNANSAAVNESLNKLSQLISTSSQENAIARARIAQLRGDILFIQDKTQNISKSVTELNQSLNKFLTDVIRVTDELDQTIEILDTYTKKDPSTILRPVRVDEKAVFKGKTEIFYRLPALVSIILLFIMLFISSSLIVNERRGGTMARIFLSPISMFFYVFEKLIYLLLLGIIASVSMLIASIIFGVPITFSFEAVLVFVVASLVYVSLGILVGSFSKSENTSLLTCLVFGFPLMFMSGAFSPPELMGKAARVISQYLPLTININLLEKITIYHIGLDLTQLLIMASMIIMFYLIAVALIWKKPTLK
jgi:ABC-type multidrug transport system permease subunit